MATESQSTRLRRRYELESQADVRRSLSQVVRKLRKLVVLDVDLDPIRINQAKALVYALRTLSQLMSTEGLMDVTDEALAAEVIRRRDGQRARLGSAPLELEAKH